MYKPLLPFTELTPETLHTTIDDYKIGASPTYCLLLDQKYAEIIKDYKNLSLSEDELISFYKIHPEVRTEVDIHLALITLLFDLEPIFDTLDFHTSAYRPAIDSFFHVHLISAIIIFKLFHLIPKLLKFQLKHQLYSYTFHYRSDFISLDKHTIDFSTKQQNEFTHAISIYLNNYSSRRNLIQINDANFIHIFCFLVLSHFTQKSHKIKSLNPIFDSLDSSDFSLFYKEIIINTNYIQGGTNPFALEFIFSNPNFSSIAFKENNLTFLPYCDIERDKISHPELFV